MLHICATCTCPFSVGAPCCPQCAGITYREQGHEDGPVRSTVTGEPIDAEDSGDAEQPEPKGRKAGQRGTTP